MLLRPAQDKAKMSPCHRVSLVLFFSLLAGTLLQSQAAPLTRELRCQCVELFSGRIPSTLFSQITLYPAGPRCPNTEVIATTTEETEVCLDPEAPWVLVAIERILENNHS